MTPSLPHFLNVWRLRTASQADRKTERQLKKEQNFPLRRFAVKA